MSTLNTHLATTPGGFPYRQFPHPFAGSNPKRQSVGDPGHCEDCVSVGHVVAHPDLGCGDVGCIYDHDPQDELEQPEPGNVTAERAKRERGL